jgi:hypothetical protein
MAYLIGMKERPARFDIGMTCPGNTFRWAAGGIEFERVWPCLRE